MACLNMGRLVLESLTEVLCLVGPDLGLGDPTGAGAGDVPGTESRSASFPQRNAHQLRYRELAGSHKARFSDVAGQHFFRSSPLSQV